MNVDPYYFTRCSSTDAGAQYVRGEYFRFAEERSLESLLQDVVLKSDFESMKRMLDPISKPHCSNCSDMENDIYQVEQERDEYKAKLEAARADLEELRAKQEVGV